MEYTVSITNKCNLKCTYCYERHLNTEYGCIDEKRAADIIRFINGRRDACRVYLFGGEPLLYKELVKKFCTEIKAREFVITTNGTLLDEEFLEWYRGKNIIINMSHDGNRSGERGISPEVLDDKLKLLIKYQPETLVQLVYTERTLPYLYENVLYLKNLGVRKISAVMDAFLRPQDPDSFGDMLREQWDMIAQIKNLYVYELASKVRVIKEKPYGKCEICKKKMFINWDGKIYPCIQFQNLGEYQCGSIYTGIMAEKTIRDHPDYAAVSERCEGCEIAKYCRNSCACKKMATTGTIKDLSEAACLEEQVHILTALELIKKKMEGN